MFKIGLIALLASMLFVPLFADVTWPEARRIARAEARQARIETLRDAAWARREAREARLDARRATFEAAREMRQARLEAARETREAAAEARRAARQYRDRWF
jgi:hypothetical protein